MLLDFRLLQLNIFLSHLHIVQFSSLSAIQRPGTVPSAMTSSWTQARPPCGPRRRRSPWPRPPPSGRGPTTTGWGVSSGGTDVWWFWIGCLPGLGVVGHAVAGVWKQAKDADIIILIVQTTFLENKMSGGSQNETAHGVENAVTVFEGRNAVDT